MGFGSALLALIGHLLYAASSGACQRALRVPGLPLLDLLATQRGTVRFAVTARG